MHTLSPSQAASMAEGVYRLRNKSLAELHRVRQPLGCEGLFRVEDDARLQGRSGAVVKELSGFGYIAVGEGAFQGQIACVTRGTQTNYDWASNGNIGLQTGPDGQYVHAGFNEIWKSYREALDTFLKGRNPSHVHCIGHSLGGALASLSADYFSGRGVAAVSLYTFGAPRAGTLGFANRLTQKVGADCIFRLSHDADPVPMIALYPFHHVPTTTTGYALGRASGSSIISVGAHSMLTSYMPGTSGKEWNALLHVESALTDREVQSWLEETANGSGVMAYSAEALRMIGRLLQWMLRKAGALTANAISLGVTAGCTLLDRLAWVLERGCTFAKDLSRAGVALATAIYRFLGYAAGAVPELTMRFLRWLLGLLLQRIGGIAQRALSLV